MIQWAAPEGRRGYVVEVGRRNQGDTADGGEFAAKPLPLEELPYLCSVCLGLRSTTVYVGTSDVDILNGTREVDPNRDRIALDVGRAEQSRAEQSGFNSIQRR